MGRILIDDELAIDILDKLLEEGLEYLAERLLVSMKDSLTDKAYNQYARMLKVEVV